ncbi:unnamed protein product, partial [Symbiodinium pilosum]
GAGAEFHCLAWNGLSWLECVVGISGDLLLLSGRKAMGEEAFLLGDAIIYDTDVNVAIVFKAGEPLRLRFQDESGGKDFADGVRKATMFREGMFQLAELAVDMKRKLNSRSQSRTSVAFSRSNSLARMAANAVCVDSEKSKAWDEEMPQRCAPSSLRVRNQLAVPTSVPMYALTPTHSSGDLLAGKDGNLSRQVSSSTRDETPPKAKPVVPRLQLNQVMRAQSCPITPKKEDLKEPPQRLARRNSSPQAAEQHFSPRDPESFASKVLIGLGLTPAKASVQATTRVQAIMSRFESKKKEQGGSDSASSSSSPTDAATA